jgi:hypothetical protein
MTDTHTQLLPVTRQTLDALQNAMRGLSHAEMIEVAGQMVVTAASVLAAVHTKPEDDDAVLDARVAALMDSLLVATVTDVVGRRPAQLDA